MIKAGSSISKYDIISPIGCGAFGQVFHVHDRALGAEKAIKILKVRNPSEIVSSLEEAQILHLCRHNHIVTINEANIIPINGSPCVVLDLELVNGGSLETKIKKTWLSVKGAVDAISQACRGLEHAHANNCLHRDIKPANILVDTTGAKLSDFGLATMRTTDLKGSANGYIPHLAPECFTSNHASQLSDIYALGVTLFRATANISDWQGQLSALSNPKQSIRDGSVIPQIGIPDFIPKKVTSIIRKSTQISESKRYQTARDFRQSLDRLRFNLNWKKTSNIKWVATKDHRRHEVFINSMNCDVIYKRNGKK